MLIPIEKSPPLTSIGRYTVEPTVICFVSMFPFMYMNFSANSDADYPLQYCKGVS